MPFTPSLSRTALADESPNEIFPRPSEPNPRRQPVRHAVQAARLVRAAARPRLGRRSISELV